ncbi:hypothetical protein M728_005682 (plasmid) [Ensifer sp. WSM1721]
MSIRRKQSPVVSATGGAENAPELTVEFSIFDLFAEHEISRELQEMSQWLDEHRELVTRVLR